MANKRTYAPTLLILAKVLLAYARRNENKIQENLGEEALALFNALVAAADAMIEYLENADLYNPPI